MKGDFTRLTFRRSNHYRSVLTQQGRVQLDADVNEQAQIQTYLDEVTGTDTIGAHGGPEHCAGMAIVDPDGKRPDGTPWARLMISQGRYYVDGILCENEMPVPLGAQPDLPGVDAPGPDGTYIARLDVWQEHITALEEEHLLEVALGGVTTTTRARTIWQVRLRSTDAAPPSQDPGRLSARAEAPSDDASPCATAVASTVGYRRLENQLYRVEIHDPSFDKETGDPVDPTFVWSRENGSVAARLLQIDGDVLTVDSVGLDDRLSFAATPLPWVEVIDLAMQRRGEPGRLGRIGRIDDTKLTIAEWRGPAPVESDFGPGAVVRRWESQNAQSVTIGDWIPLEGGVQVKFAAGRFATGDYWLIPARTANLEGTPAIRGLTGNVDWPVDEQHKPIPQPPDGVRHSYADIAVLVNSGGNWTLQSDDRHLFPPLTELGAQVDVQYAGGDGQRAVPGDALPRPLEVSVTRGGRPVSQATVQFGGDGQLATDRAGLDASPASVVKPVTGADGVARCWWRPANDPRRPSQQVTARWVPQGGAPSDPPIDFFAALDLAPPSARITAGQGQLAGPNAELGDPLGVEVRDAHGGVLPDAIVVFTVTSGAVATDEHGLGAGATEVSVVTDADGRAECRWQLGEEGPLQTLAAVALPPGSAPATSPAAVTFVAGVLAGSLFATGLHVTGVVLTKPATPLKNDQQVAVADLNTGVAVLLDGAPDPATVDGKPVLTVVLDLPFPVTEPDKGIWGPQVSGTLPLTLDATVAVTDQAGTPAVAWTPTDNVATLLSTLIGAATKVGRDRVLAHLTLSGRSIAAKDGSGVVNGLALTTSAGDPQFPSVDDVRGGDLQMRFWLVATVATLVLVPVKASRLALKSTTDAIALAISRDAVRATLRAGISVTPGPGQDAALARRAVGRAFRNGAARQLTLVVDERYATAAETIKEQMADVGVTVVVVAVADPAATVTERRAAGDAVDGVLTDDTALAPVTALPDFGDAVPL